MRAMPWSVLIASSALCACQFANPNGNYESSASGTRPALSCAPKDPQWATVQTLYDVTAEATYELIACGGVQVDISSRIVLMLIASNEDLFKKEERQIVDDYVHNPLTQTADGHWTMTIQGASNSSFTVAFYDPDSGERISENVFDLDTYLQGVHIQSEVGLSEMLQHFSRKYGFVFTWDAPGPLAHLMNDGKPLPDGFTLQLSLADFLNQSPADFGPFQSVFKLEVDSVVDYARSDSGVDVDYFIATDRDTLDHIASHQGLTFSVQRLVGKSGKLTLEGQSNDLAYVNHGVLAGSVDYHLAGKLDGSAVAMRVVNDFGADGSSSPATDWSCK